MNCLGAFSAIEKIFFNKKAILRVRCFFVYCNKNLIFINMNEIVKSQIYRALVFNFLRNQRI